MVKKYISKLKKKRYLKKNIKIKHPKPQLDLLINSNDIYREFLKEISSARNYIFLETYIYSNDEIGTKFLNALTKKVKQGVQVELLIDYWGRVRHQGSHNSKFFNKFIEAGGTVTFFNKLNLPIFTKGILHFFHRDHRKLLLIDDKIAFIGSINIVNYSLKQREVVLRIKGDAAHLFKNIFLQMKHVANKFFEVKALLLKRKRFKTISSANIKILRSVPVISHNQIKKELLKLIRKSKKEIIIETAYFMPNASINLALKKAAKRGVKISIILSYVSDHLELDIARGIYFKSLSKSGIDIYFYPLMTHGKCMLFDSKYSLIGSLNVDYLSLNWVYELNVLADSKKLASDLKKDMMSVINISKKLDLEVWMNRPFITKALEQFLYIFKRFL